MPQSSPSKLLCAAILLACLCLAAPNTAKAVGLDAAFSASQRTGLPLLIVASSDT